MLTCLAFMLLHIGMIRHAERDITVPVIILTHLAGMEGIRIISPHATQAPAIPHATLRDYAMIDQMSQDHHDQHCNKTNDTNDPLSLLNLPNDDHTTHSPIFDIS